MLRSSTVFAPPIIQYPYFRHIFLSPLFLSLLFHTATLSFSQDQSISEMSKSEQPPPAVPVATVDTRPPSTL